MLTTVPEVAFPVTITFLESVGSDLKENLGRADVCPTAVTERRKRIVVRRTGAHSR